MARLRRRMVERKVQRRAAAWLREYYVNQDWVAAVTAPALEARVKKSSTRGFGRADAVLLVRRHNDDIVTVAMEAKSYKLQSTIRPQLGCGPVMLYGGALGVAAGIPLAVVSADTPTARLVVGAGAVFAGILGYGVFAGATRRHLESSATTQVERYPADVRWIAVGGGQLRKMKDDERENLLFLCRQRGIGLVRVSSNGRIKALIEPDAVGKCAQVHLEYARGESLASQLSSF